MARGKSTGLLPGRRTVGPLTLCTLAPFFVIIFYHTVIHADGSFLRAWSELRSRGFANGIYEIWPTWRNPFVWKMITIFTVVQLLIIEFVPGKKFSGPLTPTGSVPIYKANGFQAFSLSLLLYVGGASFGFYNGGVLYDRIGEILSSMNVFALIFCSYLYVKGLRFPSSKDHGSTGNFVFDFYWGTELQPQIFGWHVKQLTNCRFGMMFWALFAVSCAYKQYETYGYVANGTLTSTALQLVYIGKFFWWETGYFVSMDMTHDRAGFYLCWGCLVFLPCVHTCQSMYLAEHPDALSFFFALVLLVAGVASIWMTYDCDQQKVRFRESRGKCKVWGEEPRFIEAKFKLENGETKTSLLLVCGYWGVTRYFHYIPEWAANMCWTLPVYTRPWLFGFYTIYLSILVLDRGFRDEARCRTKYGKYWEEYSKSVPYMFVPGIY